MGAPCSAIATAGSIVGTLVTTFFLVPLAGTKLLITGLAAGLFWLTALSLLADRRRGWAAAAAGTPLGLLRTVYQTESAYHNIRVMDGNDVRWGVVATHPNNLCSL